MKKLFVACSMLALVATPAFAQWGQEAPGFVSFGIGLTGPNSDELDAIADSSYSLSGFVSRPIGGAVGWRVEAGRDAFSLGDLFKETCDLAGTDCGDPTMTRVAGGLQLGGFGEASTLPYFAVTGGLYNVDFGAGSDSENDFGLSLVTGVNWAVNEMWGVGIDFHYNGFWPDSVDGIETDAQWYTVTTLSLFRRW